MVQDIGLQYFWLLPLLPLASAAVGGLAAARGWSRRASVAPAIAGDAAALLLAAFAFAGLRALPPAARSIDRVVGPWIPGLPLQLQDGRYAPFQVDWSLHLDPPAAGLALVLTAAALLLRVWASRREIAGLSLFFASLLLLVFAGGVVTMLAGWVGLGFSLGAWPGRPRALLAARAGDWLFVGAMVLAAGVFGSADLGAMQAAARALPVGGAQSTAAAVAVALMVAAIAARAVQVPLYLGETSGDRSRAGVWLYTGAFLAAGGYVVLRNAALFHQATAQ